MTPEEIDETFTQGLDKAFDGLWFGGATFQQAFDHLETHFGVAMAEIWHEYCLDKVKRMGALAYDHDFRGGDTVQDHPSGG